VTNLRIRFPQGRVAPLLLVVFAAVAIAGCSAPADDPQVDAVPVPPAIGEITLATPQEIRAVIEAEQGNVVVMNFWATWCPPCVKEMPELAKFWREFDGKGIRFLSVSADFAATKDSVVMPFMNSYEIPFPVRIMSVDNPDDLTTVLGLEWDGALPATFIYGPDGKVAWSEIGGTMTRDSLFEQVKPLLPAATE
jgi:thiol-disulfide isomerase/thioredoxin